jgi:hypothetical protein
MMKLTPMLLAALLLAPLHAAEPSPAPDAEWFRIPIRIHLITDLPMTKKGVAMTNWLTPEMIEKTVLPEVNRIWSGAKIEWMLNGMAPAATKPEGREETIIHLLQAKRDSEGKADPERVRKLETILKSDDADRGSVNIHVIPYLGGASQGVASTGKRRVIISQWTDKPSRGLRPPQRCLLVELGEFQQGSFSRTLAHELGHVLSLDHPTKGEAPFHRLMGGTDPGNELTDEEKTTARKRAAEFSARFK